MLAARIAEQQRAEQRGGASPGHPTQGRAQHDPRLLHKLEAEGWLEHTTEKG